MTAVIIGRFQVPKLHVGHIYLITTALYECDYVVILLGCQMKIDSRNPYSADSRRKMIHKIFPQVEIRTLEDHPGDDDTWSSDVDESCKFYQNPILYHSRDSFKSHYKGKLPMKEIPELPGYSGTQIRQNEEDIRDNTGPSQIRPSH